MSTKGIKPLNTNVLDGGASWRDRYEVHGNLVPHIIHCLTLSRDDKETVMIIAFANSSVISMFTSGNHEKFPNNSITFFILSDTLRLKVLYKSNNVWVDLNR